MTLVVGLETRKWCWMGADSASCESDFRTAVDDQKIFHRNGWLIGYAGIWRTGQLIRHVADLPAAPKTNIAACLVNEFSMALRECFTQHDAAFDMTDEASPRWYLLVAAGREMYEIQYDYAVLRARSGVNAIGCDRYALGVLDAVKSDSTRTPKRKLEYALKLASKRYGASVGPPFRYLTTEPL